MTKPKWTSTVSVCLCMILTAWCAFILTRFSTATSEMQPMLTPSSSCIFLPNSLQNCGTVDIADWQQSKNGSLYSSNFPSLCLLYPLSRLHFLSFLLVRNSTTIKIPSKHSLITSSTTKLSLSLFLILCQGVASIIAMKVLLWFDTCAPCTIFRRYLD